MRSNYKSIGLSIPKCKNSIPNSRIKCPELPDSGISKLFKKLIINFTTGYLSHIVKDFVFWLFCQSRKELVNFL